MAFHEINNNGLIYMVSDIIPYKHAFTTRFGGVSTGIYSSLNLGSNRGDNLENVKENYKRICSLFNVGINECAVTNQKHGNIVKTISKEDKHICLSDVPYEADGILTTETNLPLMCFVADCIPVILCDDINGIVSAVHCGWRSSVSDILKNCIDKFVSLGSDTKNIKVAMGASIGKCCFETDDDVIYALKNYIKDEYINTFNRNTNNKYLVDLRYANKIRLLQLGLLDSNIDISTECTFCSHDKYWSHRYTKGLRGNLCAVISKNK